VRLDISASRITSVPDVLRVKSVWPVSGSPMRRGPVAVTAWSDGADVGSSVRCSTAPCGSRTSLAHLIHRIVVRSALPVARATRASGRKLSAALRRHLGTALPRTYMTLTQSGGRSFGIKLGPFTHISPVAPP
jgi:hypothetical protein